MKESATYDTSVKASRRQALTSRDPNFDKAKLFKK